MSRKKHSKLIMYNIPTNLNPFGINPHSLGVYKQELGSIHAFLADGFTLERSVKELVSNHFQNDENECLTNECQGDHELTVLHICVSAWLEKREAGMLSLAIDNEPEYSKNLSVYDDDIDEEGNRYRTVLVTYPVAKSAKILLRTTHDGHEDYIDQVSYHF